MFTIPTFDELLDRIRTDYINLNGKLDSEVVLRTACLASALWGAYKYQEYISKQIFPDTADTENLEHHAWTEGVSRVAGETDAELLDRLLTYLRQPPAGGNKYDFEKWAKSIDYVANAWCFPIAQGLGTVDVVVLADKGTTGSEVPSIHAQKGTNTAVSASRLVDDTANFLASEDPARLGDIVRNLTDGTEAIVTAIDDETHLSLSADIFTGTGKTYTVQSQPMTGTTSGASAGKLIDGGADFEDVDGPVRIGDIVVNTDTGFEAVVDSVDSATQLGLSADIFTAAGQGYKIRSLLKQVKDYIESVRPVTAWYVSVFESKVLSQDVNVTVTGEDADETRIYNDIEAALNILIPTQTLYRTKIIAAAIGGGADNVTVNTPAADVVPSGYEMVRPGTITVTKI